MESRSGRVDKKSSFVFKMINVTNVFIHDTPSLNVSLVVFSFYVTSNVEGSCNLIKQY